LLPPTACRGKQWMFQRQVLLLLLLLVMMVLLLRP
jgi:hypothetical protein